MRTRVVDPTRPLPIIHGVNADPGEIPICKEGVPLTLAIPASQVTSTYSVAGVIALNTDLIVIDCLNFASVGVQCAAMGTAGVVTPTFSNEPTFSVPITPTLVTPAGATATTFNSAGSWLIPVHGRYLRLRLTTATTAGTTTIYTFGSPFPAQAWLPAGTNAIGDVGGVIRTAAGGLSTPIRIISAAASTNGTVVKNSTGRLYKIRGYNAAATVRYIKLYNSTTVTVGTTAVVDTIPLKPLDFFDIDFGEIGRSYATGICFGLTTGSADNDTGALTAGDIVGMNVYFA